MVGAAGRVRYQGMVGAMCAWAAGGGRRGHRGGSLYEQGGVFLAVEPPGKLAHTWGGAGSPSTVSYFVMAVDTAPDRLRVGRGVPGVRGGWDTSFERLPEMLGKGTRAHGS